MTEPGTRGRLGHDAGHWLAFGLGSGLSPLAPGTAGTVIAILFYLPLAMLPLWLYLAVTAALFLVGIVLCGRTSRALGVEDHPGIVWDEIVGYLVTMAGQPLGIPGIIAGFVLFRLFDIVKPWPVSLADRRVKGGLGIMLDDLLAGAYAWLALNLIMSYYR